MRKSRGQIATVIANARRYGVLDRPISDWTLFAVIFGFAAVALECGLTLAGIVHNRSQLNSLELLVCFLVATYTLILFLRIAELQKERNKRPIPDDLIQWIASSLSVCDELKRRVATAIQCNGSVSVNQLLDIEALYVEEQLREASSTPPN